MNRRESEDALERMSVKDLVRGLALLVQEAGFLTEKEENDEETVRVVGGEKKKYANFDKRRINNPNTAPGVIGQALREAGSALTKKTLKRKLDAAGFAKSHSTLNTTLAAMVDAGQVEYTPKKRVRLLVP